MKMIKHFPPHFAQLVFLNLDGEIERINGLDYDLFIWLIYRTHKHYSKTKDTFVEFEYMDIRESLPSKPNTKSIQSSLKKINEIQLLSNYLNSYENKEAILTTTPFKINIKPSDNGKSYGFSVASSKNFLQRFDNPTPKVSVNYIIIYKLNKMSKLLYLFLKDALGVYKNKNRKVDIEKLRHLMNISNDDTSHSNFITQLKKSTKNINEFSDIDVGYKVIKKRDLRSGKSEIEAVKFTISKNELKQEDDNEIIDTKSIENKLIIESINRVETQNSTNIETIVPTKTFDDYVNDKVEKEYQKEMKKGTVIKTTPKVFKNGIRKNLLVDTENMKAEFELVSYLDSIKYDLKEKITDNQPYMLIYTDGNNPFKTFYFNNNYQFLNNVTNDEVTYSINETIAFINKNQNLLYFDIQRCSYESKYDAGRL